MEQKNPILLPQILNIIFWERELSGFTNCLQTSQCDAESIGFSGCGLVHLLFVCRSLICSDIHTFINYVLIWATYWDFRKILIRYFFQNDFYARAFEVCRDWNPHAFLQFVLLHEIVAFDLSGVVRILVGKGRANFVSFACH